MPRKCKDWLKTYIEYTDQLESPTNYHLWCGMSIIASCLRRRVHIDMGYFKIYPNMYIVLVGPAGKCRKSASINAAIDLIEDMSDDVKISADNITREALIKAIATSEAMYEERVGVIKVHSSLSIVSKELSVFLGTGNHDLLALLTDLYDCPNVWEYRTKNQGTDRIKGVWLNMLAASTPDWLVGSLPITAIGGGFTSRVVFVVETDVRQKNPQPKLTAKEIELKELLKADLEQISMMSGVFTLEPAGDKFYTDWYMSDRPMIDDPRFHGYCERKPLHLFKVAQVVSASRGDDLIITEYDLRTALNHLETIEGRMVKAFGAAGKSSAAPEIDEILTQIEANGSLTKKDIMNKTWLNVDMKNFQSIVDTLCAMGRITVSLTESGEVLYTIVK